MAFKKPKKPPEEKNIFRIVNKQPVSLEKVLMDQRLSLKSKGLMCLCLITKSDESPFNFAHLIERSNNGRVSVQSSITELKNSGYIQQVVIRRVGKISSYEYLVFEDPSQNPFDPEVWGEIIYVTEEDRECGLLE
ncbi:hypothetical protein SAMN05444487_107144 [Marininema mesophilum]|uniref:Helix-turn-helix domain-containing protein n=1 Tax=Marininema mesophilum TaxID=1048340 RepID=A0A1H2XAR1_9BACL|nr:hypothetical protein [Marininema mesophilum]SDW89895.1 hypothetical protein SAMN05444487_107144 [Marininema mesophilum]